LFLGYFVDLVGISDLLRMLIHEEHEDLLELHPQNHQILPLQQVLVTAVMHELLLEQDYGI
jgi:hypothetical protein